MADVADLDEQIASAQARRDGLQAQLNDLQLVIAGTVTVPAAAAAVAAGPVQVVI